MAECIVALCNVVAPGIDAIIAPLLKAGLELVVWLHMVILVVWRNGKALEVSKSALVISLYKGKGLH